MLVRLVDRGAQLIARDLRVRLEPWDTLLGPVAHEPPRIFWRAEGVHPSGADAWTLEIRSGRKDHRTDGLSSFDRVSQVELLIRIDAAGRADGRHAGREEELRVARQHAPRSCDRGAVVHMVVEPDETGDHGLAAEIDHERALWCR